MLCPERLMRKLPLAATVGSMAVSAASHAGVTSTWTLASDYDLRGITQSAHEPAVQASLDYAHDSGWSIGAWASNVDFCASGNEACLDTAYELDLYTGFSGKIGKHGLGGDVGLIYYSYENSDYNYSEIYAGLSQGWFKTRLWYSNDFAGATTAGKTPAYYIEANATLPLRAKFSALAHVAYSGGDYWRELHRAGAGREYMNYSVGVGYTAGKFELALRWIDGSDLKELNRTPQDVLSSEARAVFTVATTFPWR